MLEIARWLRFHPSRIARAQETVRTTGLVGFEDPAAPALCSMDKTVRTTGLLGVWWLVSASSNLEESARA